MIFKLDELQRKDGKQIVFEFGAEIPLSYHVVISHFIPLTIWHKSFEKLENHEP